MLRPKFGKYRQLTQAPLENEYLPLLTHCPFIKGFQVFLISCIANSKPKESSETKKHLFEAYVRTRQLRATRPERPLSAC